MLPKLDIPIYETTLISTGKTIKFRPFLVKEQKIFLMAAQSEDSKEVINSIKQVLSNCVVDDTDISKLPFFDLENLFLNLRARSVGEKVELNYVCNNLENFNLSEFDVVYSPCLPIDVSKYPNTKFIFGPHFSIY